MVLPPGHGDERQSEGKLPPLTAQAGKGRPLQQLPAGSDLRARCRDLLADIQQWAGWAAQAAAEIPPLLAQALPDISRRAELLIEELEAIARSAHRRLEETTGELAALEDDLGLPARGPLRSFDPHELLEWADRVGLSVEEFGGKERLDANRVLAWREQNLWEDTYKRILNLWIQAGSAYGELKAVLEGEDLAEDADRLEGLDEH